MYKHIFLNPFYWYSVIWSSVLILYCFGWSQAYEPLSFLLTVFFLSTIVLSFLFGKYFAKLIKNNKKSYKRPKYYNLLYGAIIIGFVMEFIYCGYVPLLSELGRHSEGYADFTGIPTFHVVLVTLALFFTVYMFYCYLNEERIRYKRRFFIRFFVTALLLTLLYNRSTIMMIFFMCLIQVLAGLKKIKFKHVFISLVLILLSLIGFGILGNIRVSSKWNDSSLIISLAKIDLKKYPGFLPKSLLWAYVYVISPLGNLNNIVNKIEPTLSLTGFIYPLLPDALTKRVFSGVDTSVPLVVASLNVYTGFAINYKFGGPFGMFFMFGFMAFCAFVLTKITIKNRSSFIVTLSLLSCMFALMFFDNFVAFSGLTFAFVYAIIMAYLNIKRKAKKGKVKPNKNLCKMGEKT